MDELRQRHTLGTFVQHHQITSLATSTEKFSFEYEVYDSQAALDDKDRDLLQRAQQATATAHAPYSKFRVGAAAELDNGEIVTGSNQENASFPAGICAEGTTMSVAATMFPNVAIRNLAISYDADDNANDHPVAPCGICRQQLQEFRQRTGVPIRLIMGGKKGKVIVVRDASSLLPFSFEF
jgi:cytidine deaminase